jgi:hypothetical protein
MRRHKLFEALVWCSFHLTVQYMNVAETVAINEKSLRFLYYNLTRPFILHVTPLTY